MKMVCPFVLKISYKLEEQCFLGFSKASLVFPKATKIKPAK